MAVHPKDTAFGDVLRWRMLCLLLAGPLHVGVTMAAVIIDHSWLLSVIPGYEYSWLEAYGFIGILVLVLKGIREPIHGFLRERSVAPNVPDANV